MSSTLFRRLRAVSAAWAVLIAAADDATVFAAEPAAAPPPASAHGAAVPEVAVELFSGDAVTGQLQSLSPEGLTVSVGGTAKVLPLTDLSQIDRLGTAEAGGAAPADGGVRVACWDGTRFPATAATLTGRTCQVSRPGLASLTLPRSALRGLLLQTGDKAGVDRWTSELVNKRSDDLLLILREGEWLTLEGVVGDITADSVQFYLEGDLVPVPRARVIGMIFAEPQTPPSPAIADVIDSAGNHWAASAVSVDPAGSLLVKLAANAESMAVPDWRTIDFARGRLVSLSELDPRMVQHQPLLPITPNQEQQPFYRDQNYRGLPLVVAGVPFRRGLLVLAPTQLEYQVDRNYRRLDVSVGLDDDAGRYGDAVLRVLADGRMAAERQLSAGLEASRLQIDLTGVRVLRLEIDRGARLGLGAHVVLGSARLLK